MQEQSRAFQVDYLFEAAADRAELPPAGLRSLDWGGPQGRRRRAGHEAAQPLGGAWEMQRGSLGSGANREERAQN